MPILSMFYGTVIRMYSVDDKQHHVARIHAEYGDARAVVGIIDGAPLAGGLPTGKIR